MMHVHFVTSRSYLNLYYLIISQHRRTIEKCLNDTETGSKTRVEIPTGQPDPDRSLAQILCQYYSGSFLE